MDLALMTKKKGISGFQAREEQSQPRLPGSIIFHRIPWACAVMECIQSVAWRTSSVWTFVSLSWCLHAFGWSKSSDAMPWAKESTEFDSPFQGKHSETSSSSNTKKVSVPRRGCGCIERSLMEGPCWNPLSLSMEGGRMNGNEMNCINCMLVLVFCIFKPSLPSPPTSHKTGAMWPVFLGVDAWSDNIGGWILSHFALARWGESKIFSELRFRLSQGHLTLRYIKVR